MQLIGYAIGGRYQAMQMTILCQCRVLSSLKGATIFNIYGTRSTLTRIHTCTIRDALLFTITQPNQK